MINLLATLIGFIPLIYGADMLVDGASSLMTLAYALRHQGLWRDERGANPLDGGAPWYDS